MSIMNYDVRRRAHDDTRWCRIGRECGRDAILSGVADLVEMNDVKEWPRLRPPSLPASNPSSTHPYFHLPSPFHLRKHPKHLTRVSEQILCTLALRCQAGPREQEQVVS